MTAAEIIAALGMIRHPEGGWYAETFRDNPERGGRGHSTAIYFLLERGDVSAWHRVKDAAEVWHFYAGSPLEIRIFDEAEGMVLVRAGRRPRRQANGRRRSCRPAGGRRRAAWATGRWSAARSRRASIFRSSSWPNPAGSRQLRVGWASAAVIVGRRSLAAEQHRLRGQHRAAGDQHAGGEDAQSSARRSRQGSGSASKASGAA